MNKVEEIINLYPKIIRMINSKFTLKEICAILKEKNIIDINYGTLTSVISNIKNKKLHPEYSNIIPIIPSAKDLQIFEPYSYKFNNVWYCLKNESQVIKKEWLVTAKNILLIADPVGLLYTKRFLHLYHIPDNYLLNSYENAYGIKLTILEQEKINNISCNIKSYYSKIIQELKIKSLNNIFGD